MAQGGYIGAGLRSQTAFENNVYVQTVLFTTGSGTYTMPDNCFQIKVTCLGGGGGGGGVDGQGANTAAVGGGGSAGAECIKWIIAPSGTQYSYSVGAAGAAGASGANSGGAGGNTTFTGLGATMVGTGGNGGSGVTASTGNVQGGGGASVTATGGDINSSSMPGLTGRVAGGIRASSGDGASSNFGGGGRTPNNDSAGNAGIGFGSGGGGAIRQGETSNHPGGAGSGGLVVIEEFYQVSSEFDFVQFAATQAQMEAQTSQVNAVTPESVKYAPDTSKQWVLSGAGGGTIQASYNTASITDNGVGRYDYTFTSALINIASSTISPQSTGGTGSSVGFGTTLAQNTYHFITTSNTLQDANHSMSTDGTYA